MEDSGLDEHFILEAHDPGDPTSPIGHTGKFWADECTGDLGDPDEMVEETPLVAQGIPSGPSAHL